MLCNLSDASQSWDVLVLSSVLKQWWQFDIENPQTTVQTQLVTRLSQSCKALIVWNNNFCILFKFRRSLKNLKVSFYNSNEWCCDFFMKKYPLSVTASSKNKINFTSQNFQTSWLDIRIINNCKILDPEEMCHGPVYVHVLLFLHHDRTISHSSASHKPDEKSDRSYFPGMTSSILNLC